MRKTENVLPKGKIDINALMAQEVNKSNQPMSQQYKKGQYFADNQIEEEKAPSHNLNMDAIQNQTQARQTVDFDDDLETIHEEDLNSKMQSLNTTMNNEILEEEKASPVNRGSVQRLD